MRIGPRGRSALLSYAVAGAASLLSLIPLLWVVSSSLKSDKEIYTVHGRFLPVHPTLSHYLGLRADLPQFPGYMLNSVIVTVASVTAVVLFATLGAYPLARYRFPGRRLVFSFVLLAVAVPVRAVPGADLCDGVRHGAAEHHPRAGAAVCRAQSSVGLHSDGGICTASSRGTSRKRRRSTAVPRCARGGVWRCRLPGPGWRRR